MAVSPKRFTTISKNKLIYSTDLYTFLPHIQWSLSVKTPLFKDFLSLMTMQAWLFLVEMYYFVPHFDPLTLKTILAWQKVWLLEWGTTVVQCMQTQSSQYNMLPTLTQYNTTEICTMGLTVEHIVCLSECQHKEASMRNSILHNTHNVSPLTHCQNWWSPKYNTKSQFTKCGQ